MRGGGRGLAAAALIGVLLVAATSEAGARLERAAGIIGHDDRELLDPTAWPWLAIGRVNRTSGGFCTGTLVAPALVLTARHCLVNARTGRRVRPDTIHFLAGYRRGEWLRHGIGRAFILPDLSEAAAEANPPAPLGDDWVLIVLETALDVRPVPMKALAPEQAARARLARAGYGRDRPHLLSLHDGCVLLGQRGSVLLHDCDATYGDSGSPLLMLGKDGVFLVGMTTGAGTANGKVIGIAVDAGAFVEQSRQPPPAVPE